MEIITVLLNLKPEIFCFFSLLLLFLNFPTSCGISFFRDAEKTPQDFNPTFILMNNKLSPCFLVSISVQTAPSISGSREALPCFSVHLSTLRCALTARLGPCASSLRSPPAPVSQPIGSNRSRSQNLSYLKTMN